MRPDPPAVSGPLDRARPRRPLIAASPPATKSPPRQPRSTAWNGHSLLLLAVVTVQVVLSLRLIWTNSAYIDEATYLWAGHLELAHWLHGTAVPPFQTWLSGAPVLYPPIAALANSAGGLVAARLLSLAFMTGATVLLWGVTSRLCGVRAAFFATALFAVLGPTQFLGALATYDAMALLLMAISAWCVVAARDHDDSTLLLVAAASALALANATKYATALFDPVIVALAALVIAEKHGVKAALGRAGYIAASVTGLVAVLLALGGPLYLAGIMYTTLARAAGGDPPSARARGFLAMGGHRLGPGLERLSSYAGGGATRPRRGCWPSWPPPGCWPRWNRPASTRLPRCTSTSISGRGSRLPPPGTRWLSCRGSAAAG